jgi:hypothetical protein
MIPSGGEGERGRKELEKEAEEEDEVDSDNGVVIEGNGKGAGNGIKDARDSSRVGLLLPACTIRHADSLNTKITN